MNNIVIDATLKDKAYGERALAISHLAHVGEDDLIIFDRGIHRSSFAHIMRSDADFLVRIRRNSFKKVAFLFQPYSTGNTALAVQQDFYITMFLSNYESLLVYDTDVTLKEKTKKYKNQQKVNKSISFNAIKQRSFELFYSEQDMDIILEEMQKLFLTTPTAIRPNRVNRKRLDKDKDKSTICTNSANYYKRKKKVI